VGAGALNRLGCSGWASRSLRYSRSMEPREPAAPPAAAGEPSPVPGPAERLREARARRRRAMRQFLVVGLCFVALLCLGGVAVGYLFYDRATKPDLSTPEHVTRKYLE